MANVPTYTIFNGDSLRVLKHAEDDSIDALVCDPPAGIAFMGKEWDHPTGVGNYKVYGGSVGINAPRIGQHKGNRVEHLRARDIFKAGVGAIFAECLRVMKPGAHGLVWALPRTSHWTTTALEDAGFEIRDVVMHLFGTGFPKSLNVGKALDKAAGAVREVTGVVDTRGDYDGKIRTSKAINTNWRSAEGRADVRNLAAKEVTVPATDEAKRWEGWGTALKPAAEHWILVRKPLIGTVAQNVLEHGTGALNIDASRIATGENLNGGAYAKAGSRADLPGAERTDSAAGMLAAGKTVGGAFKQPAGRFPSHLIFDEAAAAALDEQSGDLGKSAGGRIGKKVNGKAGLFGGLAGKFAKGDPGFGDSGGASRFFYVAKAPKKDKGENNTHPTVKNTALMDYLIRLITPPGGTVLDPFMGSGSTGVAALRGGWDFIGVEREKAYYLISERRLLAERVLALRRRHCRG